MGVGYGGFNFHILNFKLFVICRHESEIETGVGIRHAILTKIKLFIF